MVQQDSPSCFKINPIDEFWFTPRILESKKLILDPQSWIDDISKLGNACGNIAKARDALADIKKLLGPEMGIFESAISKIEDFVAFVSGLRSSDNTINTLSLILLYVKTLYKGSVFSRVWDIFSTLFGCASEQVKQFSVTQKLDTQADVETKDAFLQGIDWIKSAITDWRTARSGPLARNLANLISILVTFGFIQESSEPISIGFVELFTRKAWTQQKESETFLDLIIDTVVFFLERGHAAFISGDLSMLFFDDTEAKDMDVEYAKLVAAEPVISAGKLSELSNDFLDEHDFSERLNGLISRMVMRIKVDGKNSPFKSVLANRLTVLKKLEMSFLLAQKKSPLRVKPFGLAIVGGSSVGKSTINSVVIKALLHHNGFPSKKENIVTINDADKFLSEYKPWHSAVTVDDHGNMKAEHYDIPPTQRIIDFLNNVQKACLQADIDLKGVLMLMMKMFTITSNVKHLMAGTFSNEPVSIVRRFEFFLDCRLKPECVDPLTGGLDSSKVEGFIPDCWFINLERVKIQRATSSDKKDSYSFETVLKDASLREVIEYLKVASKKHYEFQNKFVAKMESCYDAELCEHSDMPDECPICRAQACLNEMKTGLDTQGHFSDLLGNFRKNSDDLSHNLIAKSLELFSEKIRPTSLNTEGPNLHEAEERILNPMGEKYVSLKQAFNEHQERFWKDIPVVKERITETITDIYKKHKEKILIGTCAALGIGISVFAAIKLIKHFRLLNVQAEEKPPEKLATDVPNPWKKVKPIQIPVSTVGKTATRQQMIEKISKSIGFATITDTVTQKVARCGIVPMCKNYWLLPAHMVLSDEALIEVQTTPKDELGLNFSEVISKEKIMTFSSDFALVCLVNGGPVPNLMKWMMTDDELRTNGSSVYGTLIHKNSEGMVQKYDTRVNSFDTFQSTFAKFDGFDYQLPIPSFPGLCMAPFVPRLNTARIMGFHLAGKNGTPYGVSGVIRFSDVQSAIDRLSSTFPLHCHSDGTFVTEKYGIDFAPTKDVDAKHPVKFLGDDEEGQQPTIEVLGSHGQGAASFRSSVRKSVISDDVSSIMGIKRIHGPPKSSNIKKHWHRDLDKMSHPKGIFIPRILGKAREDLYSKITIFLDSDPAQLNLVHPYNRDTVLSGADGITSVDRVELNSSMGFPINKKKKLFIGPVERDVPGVTEPIDFFDPTYWLEVERMEEVLKMGDRVYTIFRGNLKDEPTKFTKDKIRVFAGCEFAFTCLVRKYYLPLVRLIQTNWLEFECAVGINAHGPEWDKLATHFQTLEPDRMIAGDYKAFDKSVAPEITMSAFSILIDIAQKAGYTSEQLTVMRGIATEICYPTYELSGIFVKIFGSNPSGHPLTVIINNIVNSLYMRYAYYFLHDGESVPLFHDRIRLVCYGDDNAMSVSSEETLFNHTTVAEVLQMVGVEYTMADKSSESIPFIPIAEISFLKRLFRYDENLGRYVAPLEVDSLAKSLHNYMHNKGSDTTPEEIAGASIRNALQEFFYHGKDIYEERRSQLELITQKNDLTIFVGDIPTYGEMLKDVLDRQPKRFNTYKDIPLS